MKIKKQHYWLISLSGLALFLWFTQAGKNIAAQIGTEIMKISDSGLRLIASFEGFSPTPYADAQGQSIGFGHFIKPGESYTSITEEQAYQLLQQDAATAEAAVSNLVNVALTQNQIDALVSFVYNVGQGNFENSTLLRLLNNNDITGAANQFARWNKSQGQVIDALTQRRAAEASLFLNG